jgi:uncharacterized phage protein gp47/JayE
LLTDPSDVVAAMVADMQARIPGWIPATGATDTAIIEVQAFQSAVILGQASGTLDSLYRYAGATLFGVQPDDATFAVADSTWTLTAAATALGATIPVDSEVKVQVTATESVGFRVVEDVTVAPGAGVTAAGEVPLVALVAGAAGSGLSGVALKVTPLDAVASIVIDGVTQGGRDAEEDEDYLDRLTRRLRRLTFGLVLPADVEEAARDIDGVARALVIDNYVAGVNELQDVSVSATSGTFTLTYSGQTTAAIAFNADAATVQARLEALSNIGVGDVICTLGPLATAAVRVEFANLLGQTNVAAMTHTDTLSGGGAAATVTTTRAGSAAVANTAASLTVVPIDSAGLPVSALVRAALVADLEASREQGFLFSVMDPVYTTINVAFSFTVYAGNDPDVVKAAAEAAAEAAVSPATFGLLPSGDVLAWVLRTKVYMSEMYAAINAAEGLDVVTALTLNGGTADVTLSGVGPLPLPGTIVGSPA